MAHRTSHRPASDQPQLASTLSQGRGSVYAQRPISNQQTLTRESKISRMHLLPSGQGRLDILYILEDHWNYNYYAFILSCPPGCRDLRRIQFTPGTVTYQVVPGQKAKQVYIDFDRGRGELWLREVKVLKTQLDYTSQPDPWRLRSWLRAGKAAVRRIGQPISSVRHLSQLHGTVQLAVLSYLGQDVYTDRKGFDRYTGFGLYAMQDYPKRDGTYVGHVLRMRQRDLTKLSKLYNESAQQMSLAYSLRQGTVRQLRVYRRGQVTREVTAQIIEQFAVAEATSLEKSPFSKRWSGS